ncbi:MAG: Trm112 family protein [Armatimonadota bacterium]|nr:Trm112 family protein [bacterium]MDW8289451.1 Trm112 family protein [Armatimonadota bacterium]
MPLSEALLRILACPVCDEHPPLRQESEESLVCDQCHRRYPIRDGIIDLLVEEEDDQQRPS